MARRVGWQWPVRRRVVNSLRELAEVLGARYGTVRNWNAAGVIPKRRDGRFDTGQVCAALDIYQGVGESGDGDGLDPGGGGGGGNGSVEGRVSLAELERELLVARVRERRALAYIAELRSRESAGALVRVEDVAEAYRRLTARIRGWFEEAPGRLALEVAELRAPLVEARLRGEFRRAGRDFEGFAEGLLLRGPEDAEGGGDGKEDGGDGGNSVGEVCGDEV